MLQVQRFTFNLFSEHTYVVYDEKTKECAIIDPGCLSEEEQVALSHFISSNHLVVKHLLNTHGHIDHVVGNAFVKRVYGVKLAIHPAEMPLLDLAKSHASQYGMVGYEPATPDIWLADKEELLVGSYPLHLSHVPGHSPGHVAFYSLASNFCIGGDVLFKNYMGRTDLPGGDLPSLLHSIRTKYFSLPDEMVLYAGHGSITTIGYEKRHNPYCRLGTE